MTYFQSPVFDLLKLGQSIGRPASRIAFAKHVVDLSTKLAQQARDTEDLNRSRELLHDQIARLVWRSYIWIFPVQTHRLDYSIYPATSYEDILPDSVLGTALIYRQPLNSQDPEARYYARLMFRTGLEWACKKAELEGRPNVYNDMPELDRDKLNKVFSGTSQSAA